MDNSEYRRMEQPIHFLEEHAARQPSLEEVADHIGLSPYYIQWLFNVWEALLRIPKGTVTSYGAPATAVGHHCAHRALGIAVGHNPIAYLMPCHRVLRTNGGIGGYRWGTARMRVILAREAAFCAEIGCASGSSVSSQVQA